MFCAPLGELRYLLIKQTTRDAECTGASPGMQESDLLLPASAASVPQ
jgi:hypothetical protein